MEDHSTIDPTYVEDYLLTYVIFNNKAHDLVAKLLKWFDRGQLKDKVLLKSEFLKIFVSLILRCLLGSPNERSQFSITNWCR